MQKHHWQIVAGAFAGLLLVTTGLALRQNHFLLALLWGFIKPLASCRCDGVLAGYEIDLAY